MWRPFRVLITERHAKLHSAVFSNDDRASRGRIFAPDVTLAKVHLLGTHGMQQMAGSESLNYCITKVNILSCRLHEN